MYLFPYLIRSKLYYLFRIFQTVFHAKRLWNLTLLQISYWLSIGGIVTKWKVYPQFISIEPANICNLRCPECPVGMRLYNPQSEKIKIDLVKKIFREISSYTIHSILYFQGEPLLNNKFVEIVKIAHQHNLLTSTSTNAQLIDRQLAKYLVESKLDRLIVSIDGTTQETYETYRVGGKLNKAIEAVENIVFWKKRLNKPHPFVEIQFLVLKSNEHQIKEIKSLTKSLSADKLTLKSAQLYDFENGNPQLTTIYRYARYQKQKDGKYHIKSKQKNRCKRLWKGAVINAKGEILPCCFDKDSSFVFGNLNTQTLLKSWHSKSSYQFRKKILSNRKQFEMCRNCSE